MEARAARMGRNEALFRQVNERLEALNETLSAVTDTFEIVCECGNADCVQQIPIAVESYERARSDSSLFLLVPGHESTAVEEIVERQDAYYLVRKRDGLPRQAAEQTDLRRV